MYWWIDFCHSIDSYQFSSFLHLIWNTIWCICLILVAANKGEAEPERKETRTKVDEDRKHEYPLVNRHIIWLNSDDPHCYHINRTDLSNILCVVLFLNPRRLPWFLICWDIIKIYLRTTAEIPEIIFKWSFRWLPWFLMCSDIFDFFRTITCQITRLLSHGGLSEVLLFRAIINVWPVLWLVKICFTSFEELLYVKILKLSLMSL